MSLRKFKETNLYYYKKQMQDYLIVRDQIDPIGNVTAPARTKLEECNLLDPVGHVAFRCTNLIN